MRRRHEEKGETRAKKSIEKHTAASDVAKGSRHASVEPLHEVRVKRCSTRKEHSVFSVAVNTGEATTKKDGNMEWHTHTCKHNHPCIFAFSHACKHAHTHTHSHAHVSRTLPYAPYVRAKSGDGDAVQRGRTAGRRVRNGRRVGPVR